MGRISSNLWVVTCGLAMLLGAACTAAIGGDLASSEARSSSEAGLMAAPLSTCEALLVGDEWFVIDDQGLVVAVDDAGEAVCVDTVEATAAELRLLGLEVEAQLLEQEAQLVLEDLESRIQLLEPNPQPSAPTPGLTPAGMGSESVAGGVDITDDPSAEPNPQPSRTASDPAPAVGDAHEEPLEDAEPNPQPSCPADEFWHKALSAAR